MFQIERYNQILSYMEKHSPVSVQELAEKLYASASTIRRDLSELERQGLIMRIHGGAVLATGSSYDPPATMRMHQNIEEKQKIAALAERFLAPGESYFFDSSSTAAVLAQKAANLPNIRIVTNGVEIPEKLGENENVSVISCGGKLRAPWGEFTGSITLRTIAEMNADTFFFSCGGFSAERGATEYNDENVAVKRAFMKNSRSHILLCGSSKFNQVLFFNSAAIDEVDYIITDRKPEEKYLRLLGGKLIYGE